MPVALEFINILVPYQKLIKVFPGGQTAFDAACRNAGAMWHDGHLVRLGSMDDFGIWQIESDFKEWGLKPKRDFGFHESWVEINPEGISLPCAALKGKADAALVGSHNFQAF